MSYRLLQRLSRIEDEFRTIKASVGYLERFWTRLHPEPEFVDLKLLQVRQTESNIETTYLVRLFSEFESILRGLLPARVSAAPDRRSVYDLINRAASKWRIPASLRDDTHRIRESRNLAVHQNSAAASAMTFPDALAALNRFLAWLP